MPTTQTIVDNFKTLKTLPHVAIKLSQMLSDKSVTIEELDDIIRLDPTLVVRLLKLVNSAYFSLIEKVHNISTAIVFLGMDHLRNMVVVEALKDIYQQSDDSDLFSRSRLWFHSAVVAIISQMISERIFSKKGENAFLCGILHDIGLIIEDQVVKSLLHDTCALFDKTPGRPFIEIETAIIGTHHGKVGGRVAMEWKMPEAVQEGILLHHSEDGPGEPSTITSIVQIAQYFAIRMNYSSRDHAEQPLSSVLRQHIHDNIGQYKTILRDLPDEISKAKAIYNMEAEA